jgi:hypothetical protein
VIVEEGTRNASIISRFSRQSVEVFPSPPQTFAVFAVLAGGRGATTLTLAVSRPDAWDDVYRRSWRQTMKETDRESELPDPDIACTDSLNSEYTVLTGGVIDTRI